MASGDYAGKDASAQGGGRAERMRAALESAFSPAHLAIRDDSAKHAGHAGARPGGETHYHVEIRAEAFRGLSRLEMHRRVHAALQREFSEGLHALSIDAGAD